MRKKTTNPSDKKRKEVLDIILKIVKTIDPIIQTSLFVSFFFMTDIYNRASKSMPYHKVLHNLIYFQLFSVTYHIFLKFPKKLKVQRWIFIPVAFAFTKLYEIVKKGGMKYNVNYVGPRGVAKYDVLDTGIMTLGLAIAGWYFIICLVESQSLLKQRARKKY
ncbi:MAG: hypothetical protein EBX41_09375 [Chitinophagia bacterium]|nr:hypothetical protein [Chitinophagia bacterium]